ncbi:site-specific DNA-methyltransferase [Candidatus Uhrbacteria bacterium]|nr:site-specific DNA-methyltransferase [Candidatus Uhrbacteria bacterium]
MTIARKPLKKAKNIKKIDSRSLNPQADLLGTLKSRFPEIFTEGQVDCDRLKKTLGDLAETGPERYGLSWHGKTGCFRAIQSSTAATLKPNRKESVDFDKTGNVFIEGDNLEALKVMQKSYYGKVKMIYIDPPYNTGNDFIYNDSFRQDKAEYEKEAGIRDEEGNRRSDGLFRNTADRGHYHSDWLNMIYPRLFLARNLLRQDGVIFVSIDDHEVHNLRMAMNEVFGENNFVTEIVWHSKYTVANDTKYLSKQHEYVLLFAKNKDDLRDLRLPRTAEMNDRYTNPDDDTRGPWKATPLHAKSGHGQSYVFRFKNGVTWKAPQGRFPRYSQNTLKRLEEENRLWFGKDLKTTPSVKTYLAELPDERVAGDVWSFDEVGHTHASNEELADIVGKGIFDNPKPTGIIKKAIQLACKQDDTILDFFAGSGTTAHAVIALNAEDGGNRKCISIQLPEETDESSEAHKAGFRTIADITKERIRRAGKKVVSELADKETGKRLDIGFKAFRLEKSNFKIWNQDIRTEEELLEQMEIFRDNLEKGATQENVLYELILKSGLDLNVPIERKKADRIDYYSVDGGKLAVCLADKITKKMFDEILAAKPEKIICLDTAFGGDDQLKTNALLQAESVGVGVECV